MSVYFFGVGRGRLTQAEIDRRTDIAARHDCEFVHQHGDGGLCLCGRGCAPGQCDILHWWFTATNRGRPFGSQTADLVLREVRQHTP
jgi:hypothetical protein